MSDTHFPLDHLRHSGAHVLAMAAVRLFPGARLGVGPVTAQGFYHDIQFPHPISWEDIQRLEQEMLMIIQEELPFTQIIVPRDQAYNILLMRGQVYKAELLESIGDLDVSFYKTGEEFIDLCRGPHVPTTRQVGAVKLLQLEETFWKADETRPKMQRIYGTAFHNLIDLRGFVQQQSEIQNRDYRKIAVELGMRLPGNKKVIYSTTGAVTLQSIQHKIVDQFAEQDYQELILPPARTVADHQEEVIEVINSKNRSYRELPLRVFHQTRSELSVPIETCGKEFFSITAVEAFSFDDDGVGEIERSLRVICSTLASMGLQSAAKIYTATTETMYYRAASDTLTHAMVSQTHIVDPLRSIHSLTVEFTRTDDLGREWLLGYFTKETSKAKYVSSSGEFGLASMHKISLVPDVILAYYLEHEGGKLPFWLSPVQAYIIPITDLQHRYSDKIGSLLAEAGIRNYVDKKTDTMQAKIRQAELRRCPLLVIIGEKEEKHDAVSLRLGDKKEVGMVTKDQIIPTLEELNLI